MNSTNNQAHLRPEVLKNLEEQMKTEHLSNNEKIASPTIKLSTEELLERAEQMFLETLADYETLLVEHKKLEQQLKQKDQQIAELTEKLNAVRELVV